MDEIKKQIIEMDIIRYGKCITIQKNKISDVLMKEIISRTESCRDNLTERIYWIMNNISEHPRCLECNTSFYPKFRGYNFGYRKFCSSSCSVKNPNTRNKMKETYFNKTGFEHSAQNPECLDKMKITFLERNGVLSNFHRNEVQQTIIDNLFQKTGYVNQFQIPEVVERIKRERFDRTGYENPQQDPEVFLRTQRYKTKELILPSNRKIKYQGYENIVINELLKTYNEDEIVFGKNIPEIWYIFENKKKKYFPDLYIPSEELIIEVKSYYTYEKDLEKNLAKKQGCIQSGFNFQFWICSEKNIEEII